LVTWFLVENVPAINVFFKRILSLTAQWRALLLCFLFILQGVYEAAGPGFEPGLSDPESVFICSPLFLGVRKTACSSRVAGARVSLRSSSFARVAVKSLSRQQSLQLPDAHE
jgi:hypothetical protein